MDIVVTILFTLGASFVLLAGIGAVRFPDVWSRMHAAAKAPVLGFLLIGAGVMLELRDVGVTLLVALTLMFQMMTSPVGSHMLARSTYRKVDANVDGPDELYQAEHRDDQPLDPD